MNDNDVTYLGFRSFGRAAPPVEVAIARKDRRQHLYVIGKTGTGKTTLLTELLTQDLEAGEGLALLDPHGDVAEQVLDYVPPWRTDHVVYFHPADLAHPVGFNVVASQPPERRHLAVSGVVSAFKAIWQESWGPRLEYILANAIAALIELPGTTLLHLPRLLADDVYRLRAAARIEDPVVRFFWQKEFAGYDKRFRAEAIAPVQNKIGQFLMSPMVRNIFGQERSAIDPRFLLDRRRILIANLAKGKVGEDKANLIGALLVSIFQTAAAARADTPEAERPDFYLYADEFQNFATDSFASILSEARKYRLCLSLFHQFEEQLSEAVRAAVFGNVGTMIAFRVGQRDAEHLSREFEHEIRPETITALDPFAIVVRLLEEGRPRRPFEAYTAPPRAVRYNRGRNIKVQSRMRFGRPRARVERAVARLMQ
jgi:hypothetical protein